MSHASSRLEPEAFDPSSSMALAQRCLGLTLCYDYLSTGQGHRQTRRVVGDRLGSSDKALLTVDATLGPRERPCPAANAPRCFPDPEQRYLWEVARSPRLTSGEEYCLAVRMKAGDRDAHDALLQANLGLVVMFARRYQRPGVPLLDLVAEGNLGLIQAVRRFDPERGHRFATYAKWWVRQAIQTALPRLLGIVRLPAVSAGRRASAAQRGERSEAMPVEAQAFPFEATADEALPTGCALLDTPAGTEPPPGEPMLSWTAGCDIGDGQALDSIAIPPEQEPPGHTLALQRHAALMRALDTLNERDRVVVSERYALVNDRACTLDELAKRFSVSIERIRQIENAAVKKLAKALGREGGSAATLL